MKEHSSKEKKSPATVEKRSDRDAQDSLSRYFAVLEAGPTTTYARQLIADGIELPHPDSLEPEKVHEKLWEVIRGLADRGNYLASTDHLDDRELYRKLWEDILVQETYEMDEGMGDFACHIDLVSSGSEEANRIYLQYYADELEREDWSSDYPEIDMPPSLDPPHDRDRLLPTPGF